MAMWRKQWNALGESGWPERLATPAALAGNLTLAWLVADLIWSAVVPVTWTEISHIAQRSPSAAETNAETIPRADIASLHLMGEFKAVSDAPPPPKPKPKPKVRPPTTDLSLTLRGVIRYPGRPDQTRVMLAGADGKEKIYRSGDAIDERAKLLEIGAREVILEVDGERQILEIAKAVGGGAAPSSRLSGQRATRTGRWPSNPGQAPSSQTPGASGR